MIKLIASDLDGTLIPIGEQALDPGVFDLIKRLKAKGLQFVAASGRQYANMRDIFAPIVDEIIYISENGALCTSQGEVLFRGSIERELGLRIIHEVRRRENCEVMLNCENKCYIESTDESFVNRVIHIIKNDAEVVNDLTEIKEPFLKLAFLDKVNPAASYDHFQKLFGEEIRVVTSGNMWTDFMAFGADKGTALKHLLQHLNLTPDQCMAFGDQQNDIEMLELAGASYAMEAAAAEVQQHAVYTTGSVEEELEKLLKQLA